MLRTIKASARRILPSRVVAALGVLFRGRLLVYSGSYRSWDAAKRDAVGYDDPAILEKIRQSALAVKDGRAAFESDSIAHAKPEFRWPLLACILTVALQRKTSDGSALHILDFGGSLGSVYFQHRAFLERIPALSWSIVEQPHFVRCGNAEFADDRLRFFDTIAQAGARGPIDVAIFSGSLGYVDEPYKILAEVAALGVRSIILDQLQMFDRADDEFKLQHIKPPLYSAKLAVRFFAKRKLLASLNAAGYELVAPLPIGFFFERRSTTRP
ncbi:MAG TPA: methyltransferase, TIGR04325 family [Pseudolabrys sp.]|nr:methyltransferase, TIGR04325 family [Pseudolabrys sp.]